MAYTIYKTNGQQLTSLLDGTLDDKYIVKLVGKNYINYGTAQNENFIYLLENFANDTAPVYPLTGQLWYDTASQGLKYYNGTGFNQLANVNQLGDGVDTLKSFLVANVAALNAAILSNAAIQTANAAVQDTNIVNLWANAAVQNNYINEINANVAGSNVRISTLETTTTTHTSQIAGLTGAVTLANANIIALQSSVSSLTANAASQQSEIKAIQDAGYITTSALSGYAVSNSPTLTGTPTAPTFSVNDESDTIATTQYVANRDSATRTWTTTQITNSVNSLSTSVTNSLALKAPLSSPTLTGTPTAPTVSAGDVSTKIATTAFVKNATQYWDGSRKFVSTSSPTSSDGSDGDIWFQYS